MISYGQTVHGEDEIEAVVKVLRTSTQMGVNVRTFEAKVADLLAKNYGVMVNSGSSANFLAVRIACLPKAAEVITPALTFATTVAPILQHDLRPAFVDVEPSTYNIDVNKIPELVNEKTAAMMIPNLIGNFVDWDAIRAIADQYNLFVIEDSADTLGATLRGKSTGSRSDISTTSFYGSHVINCAGNGGMLCVNDQVMRDRAKLLRSWGRDSSLFVDSEKLENRFNVEIDGIQYDSKFVFSDLGYNFEPSELGAAFGLVQLDKLERNIAEREKWYQQHRDFFKKYEDWFVLPRQPTDSRTGWLAFALTLTEEAPFSRTQMQMYLEGHGIQTRPVFTGNILRQPGFKHVDARTSSTGYPNADAVMRGGILIGCHHGLDQQQVDTIHQVFSDFAAAY